MKFWTDDQTILDLNIFSKSKGDFSIFDIYNSTTTKGGRDELMQMMRIPLVNLEEINDRLFTIKFICDNNIECWFDNEYLDFIEYYLNQNTSILKDNLFHAISAKLSYLVKESNEYYIIQRGLEYLRNHLVILSDFLKEISSLHKSDFINQLAQEIQSIKDDPELSLILSPNQNKFTFRQINHFDFLIRNSKKELIKRILKLTYQIDAYVSIAQVAQKRKFCFPEISKSSKSHLKVNGLFHPFLDAPVKNDLNGSDAKNLYFVSGANMSGKSTFLKSVGLCVYLSHIGFPVPANKMESSMFKGLYTTINISDDIYKGYSHYYSEVRRVKDVALNIKEKKKVLIIFDELFRGTNVKDAFDATLMVAKGFSQIKDSLFFISTHIVEVAEELEKLNGIDFRCFESHLKGDKPVYNYKLVEGISAERLGLTILKNEKVFDIINEIINQ